MAEFWIRETSDFISSGLGYDAVLSIPPGVLEGLSSNSTTAEENKIEKRKTVQQISLLCRNMKGSVTSPKNTQQVNDVVGMEPRTRTPSVVSTDPTALPGHERCPPQSRGPIYLFTELCTLSSFAGLTRKGSVQRS